MEMREFPRPVIGPDDGALLRVEACASAGLTSSSNKGAMGTRGLPMIPGHEPLGIIEEIAPATAARWGSTWATGSPWRSSSPAGLATCAWPGATCSARTGPAATAATTRPSAASACGAATPSTCTCTRTRSCTRCAPTSGRDRRHVQPAGRGRALGAAVRRRAPGVIGARAWRRAAGLAAILASKYVGAGLIIATGLARDEKKLTLAREFGADHTINVDEEDTVERVKELTGGDGVDVVLDLTPMAQQPIRDAINAVRWGGTIVLAGLKATRRSRSPPTC